MWGLHIFPACPLRFSAKMGLSAHRRITEQKGQGDGGVGGDGALNHAAAKCQTLIVGHHLLNLGEELWRNP